MNFGKLLVGTKAGQFYQPHRRVMLLSSLTFVILLGMGMALAQPVTEARLVPVPFFIQPVSALGENVLAAEEGVLLNMAIREMPG